MRRGAAVVLLVLLGVTTAPAPRAQEAAAGAALAIDVAVGFSDTFRPGHGAPVTVTVANEGPDVDGWLEVVSSDGDAFRGQDYRVVHQRRLSLTRGARKRFHFTIYLPGLSQPFLVRVTDGGRELAREEVDLRRRFTAERLLLVVSRDADLDYLNEPGGHGLRVLYPHPDRLPHRWQGYDGVSAVLLHGVALERLAAAQYEALRRWVAGGGVLAVSGGPDFTLLRSPRYAALLPAIPTGTVSVQDPAAAGSSLGVPLDGAGSFLVHRLAAGEGEVLHAAPGGPLVVAQRRGRGKIVYLAFDVARPPFERLPALAPLWRRLLDLPLDTGAGELFESEPAAPRGVSPVKAMLGGQRGGFPGHGTVLVFLALYLGALATGLRLRPSSAAGRRLAPLLTWAAPLVFAPAAWLLFGPLLFERGTAAVMIATVEPMPGSGYARLHLDLGLYRHRRGALRFGYDGAEPTFRVPVRWRAGAGAEAWLFNEDASPFVEPLDRRPFVLHLLEGRDVIPFAVDGAVARAGEGLAVTLHNRSGWPLYEAWLVAEGRAWPLGEVAHGGRVERRLDPLRDALPVGDDGWTALLERWTGITRAEREAARAVIARASDEHRDAAVLVARTRSPLRVSGGEDEWRRTELVLVLAPLALDPAPVEAAP